MTVFYSTQHKSYLLWTGSRFLEFREGVLSTDEMGAEAIRRHPMYGRWFTETPPLPSINLHPELDLAGTMVLPTESYDCPECDETLPSRMALQMHIEEKHRDEAIPIPEPRR